MLIFKKAALESHIIVIIFISMIMAFLLVFLLNGIYGQDDAKCLNVKFDIQNLCQISTTAVSFNLVNDYSDSLMFTINSKRLPNYFLDSGVKKKIIVNLKNTNILQIIPIVSDNGYNYECHGKVQNRNVEVIKKC